MRGRFAARGEGWGMWKPCCDSPARAVSCVGYFGPDEDDRWRLDMLVTVRVSKVDGTPREEWPEVANLPG